MGSAAGIGVLGGSFDPIHNGHLLAASQVAAQLNLSKVLFVPAGNQWQKTDQTLGSHRLQMVQLAVADNEAFEVSQIDLERTGPTYTVDTLTGLQRLNPGSVLFFIAGTDAVAGMDSWHQAELLDQLATVVVVTRPGHDLQVPSVLKKPVVQVQIPALDISSTDIRDRVSKGLPIRYLVPDQVADYIFKHRLYQGGSVE